MDIKNIAFENGVKKIFKMIVASGEYAGEYVIESPDGWNQADSIVNVDDELFFVKDFIIGNNEKLTFWQYSQPIAFNILKNVNEEQRGDGHVVFKWIAVKEGVEYDLLQDNFEVNFNKYSLKPGKSMFKIEIELIKSEARNKLFNREDTTVDLFGTKDLDENVITPVETFPIGYKKGNKTLTNLYYYDISQSQSTVFPSNFHFLSFARSEEYEFGDNTNDYAGMRIGATHPYELGPFVYTNITLKKIEIEIVDLHVKFRRQSAGAPAVTLFAIVIGNNYRQIYGLKAATPVLGSPDYSEIKIDYQKFPLLNPENLQPGQSLNLVFNSDEFFMYESVKTNTSIIITTNMESPLVRTSGIRLIEGFRQLVKSYTASSLNVISNFLGVGGTFFNTSISTGIFLRGLPLIYTTQKIKTSMKSMLTDGAAKLLTLGYDIIGNNVVIEDLKYFFKDIRSYDLSNKQYLNDYNFENDKDVTFNNLVFGSKKYSTKIKDDIQNFITMAEFSTPITTVKNKFDKQTDLIIDEYKIQELIEDKSTSTNDNDDDLVLIDMVEQTNYWDSGVFENCFHSIDSGYLLLTCTSTAFDTTMIQVGGEVQIMEGINAGPWTVLSIDGPKMKLSKSSGIVEGASDTPLRYNISSLIKNRSMNDGFTGPSYIRNPETATNARHNPKYHMARWFQFFGSGLTKKKGTDIIKVTNYKNEERASMKVVSPDLANELPGTVVVGANEPLSRLRANTPPLFNGQTVDIKFTQVTFEEFISLYENWRYGIAGNRLNSRGYITINSPIGILDVYPFGDGAFSHNRRYNTLGIKGKIKGKAIASPILISAVQVNRNTFTLVWDYVDEFVNPVISIQYSLDGQSWNTVKTVNNIKTDTVTSTELNNVLTGTDVYFRITVNSDEYFNKISNTQIINWQFNDYRITEIRRAENLECGYSELVFDIEGTVDLDVEWTFNSYPGGGKAQCIDYTGPEQINIVTDYGIEATEIRNTTISVDGDSKRFELRLYDTDKDADLKFLKCYKTPHNNEIALTSADMLVKFTNTDTSEDNYIALNVFTTKYY